jgi:ABC-type transport system involved in multi-copper enzyme maturation permease subunit
MSVRDVPTNGDLISTIARLSLKRVLRGKMLWFMLAVCCFPTVISLVLRMSEHNTPERVAASTFGLERFLFAILAPLLVGAAVGDELGSKTATYLWSRPIPRWTIVVGKLAVLAPLTSLLLVGSWLIALLVGGGLISAQALFALAFGGLVASALVASLATLAPKQGILWALLYMLLIDLLGLNIMPGSISDLSVIHQTGVLAHLPTGSGEILADENPLSALIFLVVVGAGWLTVALRSLRTRET